MLKNIFGLLLHVCRYWTKKYSFVVIIVPADGLAPVYVRPFAGTVRTTFWTHIYLHWTTTWNCHYFFPYLNPSMGISNCMPPPSQAATRKSIIEKHKDQLGGKLISIQTNHWTAGSLGFNGLYFSRLGDKYIYLILGVICEWCWRSFGDQWSISLRKLTKF